MELDTLFYKQLILYKAIAKIRSFWEILAK